jgi:hypothetical protein
VVRDGRRGLSRIHVARNVSAQVPKLSSALPYAYVKGCKTELEKNNNNDNQQEKILKYEAVARMRKSGERRYHDAQFVLLFQTFRSPAAAAEFCRGQG